jgi:hypothetical protein
MVDRIRLHMAAIDCSKTVGKAGQTVEIRIEELVGIRTAKKPSRATPKAVLLGDKDSVHATLISRARRHVLRAILANKLTPGAIPVTTCNYTYLVLSDFGTRKPDARLVECYVDPETGTNPITGFLNQLRRPMLNTYRRVDYANLWKYIKEFEFGFNRRMRSHEIFDDLVGHFPDLSPHRVAALAASPSLKSVETQS